LLDRKIIYTKKVKDIQYNIQKQKKNVRFPFD